MPTYQYACTACEHRFEAVQKFTDDSLTVCPECSGALRKVYGSVGVVFKGSGWYRTDSRGGAVSPKGDSTKSDSSTEKSTGSSDSGSTSSSSSDSTGSTGAATPAKKSESTSAKSTKSSSAAVPA